MNSFLMLELQAHKQTVKHEIPTQLGSFLNLSKQLYNDYSHSLVLFTDNTLVASICQALW